MLPRLISLRQFRPIILIFSLIFIYFYLISVDSSHYLQCSLCSLSNLTSTRKIFYKILNNTEDERTSVDDYSIWCLHMAHRLDNEQIPSESAVLKVPSINSTRLHRLPYYYSEWNSSPVLPRRITPCEHSLIMRLLMIIERICRKHQITFMLGDGTLLGSLRHHDIVPWDDDIDIMISIQDQTRFTNIIEQMNQTLIQYRIVVYTKQNKKYYKIFFKNTPQAGKYRWGFPFIDVFFYIQNETHLWQMGDPDTAIQIKYVFPLVMRPFGELWLPAARQPQQVIKFDPFDLCKGHFWDHRNEKEIIPIVLKCDDLKYIYPFVEKDNQSNSTEILKLNNKIIHTIIYD